MSDPDLTVFGYTFRDTKLLQQALTHRSVKNQPHNERLEFLGDAILGMVVAERLYRDAPDADEGTLTRTRAELVKGSALAQIAHHHCLQERLQTAPGTVISERLLASAVEAILGAIFIEAGFEKIREIILEQVSQMENLPAEDQFNAKGALQEFLQPQIPVEAIAYQDLNQEGPPNQRIYTVGLKIGQIIVPDAVAKASSKKKAQNQVAIIALQKLKTDRQLLKKITNSYYPDC